MSTGQPHHTIGAWPGPCLRFQPFSMSAGAALSDIPEDQNHVRLSQCILVSPNPVAIQLTRWLSDCSLPERSWRLQEQGGLECNSAQHTGRFGVSVIFVGYFYSYLFPEPKMREGRPPCARRPRGRSIGPQQARTSLQGSTQGPL